MSVMHHLHFVETLRLHFGAIIRNEWHVQVPTEEKGKFHNIWPLDHGVKYLRPGAAKGEKAQLMVSQTVFKRIRKYQAEHEGIVDLRTAKLDETINELKAELDAICKHEWDKPENITIVPFGFKMKMTCRRCGKVDPEILVRTRSERDHHCKGDDT